MATHSGSVTQHTSQYGCYISVYEVANSMNIEKNTTQVRVEFHITRKNYGWSAGSAQSGNIIIDGTTYNFSYKPNWAYGSSGDEIIASFTKEVKHNDDGSYWCNASANWWTSGTYSCGTASASGGISLSVIPRASTVACSSPNIGDTAIITINKKSSSFTNTLTYKVGNLTGTICTKTTDTSVAWTTEEIADAIYEQMPNATNISGTITCTTYNGNTNIGSNSCSFNLYAKQDECKPSVAAVIEDTYDNTIALTGDSSKIVKYLSIPKVTMDVIFNKASTESANNPYLISIGDGQFSNSKEAIFSGGISSSSISAKAVDSRNYSTTVAYELNSLDKWVEYVKLAFTNISIKRPESTSPIINIDIAGNYFNGNFGKVQNSLNLKYRYKETGGEYSDYITITPIITENSFSASVAINNTNMKKQYEFEIIAEDEAMLVTSGTKILQKGKGVLRIGDGYVNVEGELRILEQEVLTYEILEEW